MRLIGLIAVTLSLTGCMSIPDRVDANWLHVSHPLLGPPFGPAYEEDTLDVMEIRASWERGRMFSEMGLGAQMKDSGFYGDGFIFTSRVGVRLFGE